MRFSPGCACCATSPCSTCAGGQLATRFFLTVLNVASAAGLDGISVQMENTAPGIWEPVGRDGLGRVSVAGNPCGTPPPTSYLLRLQFSCGTFAQHVEAGWYGADGTECLNAGADVTVNCAAVTGTSFDATISRVGAFGGNCPATFNCVPAIGAKVKFQVSP